MTVIIATLVNWRKRQIFDFSRHLSAMSQTVIFLVTFLFYRIVFLYFPNISTVGFVFTHIYSPSFSVMYLAL